MTPPGIEVLDGRELGHSDVLIRTRHPLYKRLAGGCQAVAVPIDYAASQNSLNGAAVELFEDLRAHAESFQRGKRRCRALFTTVCVLWSMLTL